MHSTYVCIFKGFCKGFASSCHDAGFSRQMVGILKEENVKFSSFDILADEEVTKHTYAYP